MKLSDVIKEIQEFIEIKGDKPLSGIEVGANNSSFSTVDINNVEIISDGRYAVIYFSQVKDSDAIQR